MIGTILSVLSFVGYVAIFSNMHEQASVELQTQADAKRVRELQLNTCLKQSEDAYWAYIKVNASSATPQTDGSTMYRANQPIWDTADNSRTTARNECYRRYPNL